MHSASGREQQALQAWSAPPALTWEPEGWPRPEQCRLLALGLQLHYTGITGAGSRLQSGSLPRARHHRPLSTCPQHQVTRCSLLPLPLPLAGFCPLPASTAPCRHQFSFFLCEYYTLVYPPGHDYVRWPDYLNKALACSVSSAVGGTKYASAFLNNEFNSKVLASMICFHCSCMTKY